MAECYSQNLTPVLFGVLPRTSFLMPCALKFVGVDRILIGVEMGSYENCLYQSFEADLKVRIKCLLDRGDRRALKNELKKNNRTVGLSISWHVVSMVISMIA